ncbi:MAG: hypothetical protein GVY12_01995 [Bacteroidetes bacterium]|jgi:GTP cyclohydrolase FolE2|nr:hypothetical protein [Bacteroidota bacterium]
MEEVIQFRAPEGFKAQVMSEAEEAGTSMSRFIRQVLRSAISEREIERMKWKRRQDELSQWDDADLEQRLSALLEQRSRSDEDERELKFIGQLLDERVRQSLSPAA